MLESIKILLGITTEKEDSKLNIYIGIAKALIKRYLNNDAFDGSYIEENFSMAIILIVTNAYECKKNGNLKSKTQGSRSETYADNTAFCINDDIKATLPAPYITMYY